MCYPKFYHFKICNDFHIHDIIKIIIFPLGFVSLCNKNNYPLLLLLKVCKLSYYFHYKCFTLRYGSSVCYGWGGGFPNRAFFVPNGHFEARVSSLLLGQVAQRPIVTIAPL